MLDTAAFLSLTMTNIWFSLEQVVAKMSDIISTLANHQTRSNFLCCHVLHSTKLAESSAELKPYFGITVNYQWRGSARFGEFGSYTYLIQGAGGAAESDPDIASQ